MTMLNEALRYAEAGFHIIPVHSVDENGSCSCGREKCENTAKHPVTRNGSKDATRDRGLITRWWTRFPNANIGIATGRTAGFFVLDVDADKGGFESLRKHPEVPDTLQAITGGGGAHFFFRPPKWPVQNKRDMWPGVDIRGDGGYVVAPPSWHRSGRQYQWEAGHALGDIEICEMPTWLADDLYGKPRPPVQSTSVIPQGTRDDTLFRIGASVRARGGDEHDILEALRRENERCQPPMRDDELVKKSQWITAHYPQGQGSLNVRLTKEPSPITVAFEDIWHDLGLACGDKGKPIINLDNTMRVLQGVADFKSHVWYDEFHNKILTADGRPWDSHDDIGLTIQLQRSYGLAKLTPTIVRDAVVHLAKQNKKNEPRDWMETLTWDGEPRIENFFHLYLGAPATDYVRAASKNWWVSMAARIYKPGCKVDTMVILEGEQGAKKSSTLECIGGNWYKQLTEHFDSKDLYIGFQGKLIIEVAELDAFRKADASTIKKIISNPSDHYRPLYERQNAEAPRRCVFVGTTNHGAYLEDETGARRFWPIECTAIDLDAIRDHRDQLFAEAVHCFKLGHTWWEMPRQSTLDEQEKRYRGDAWDELISDYLDYGNLRINPIEKMPPIKGPFQEITLLKIATDALKILEGHVDQAVTKRIARSLRSRDWKPVTIREGKNVTRKWVRP